MKRLKEEQAYKVMKCVEDYFSLKVSEEQREEVVRGDLMNLEL